MVNRDRQQEVEKLLRIVLLTTYKEYELTISEGNTIIFYSLHLETEFGELIGSFGRQKKALYDAPHQEVQYVVASLSKKLIRKLCYRVLRKVECYD